VRNGANLNGTFTEGHHSKGRKGVSASIDADKLLKRPIKRRCRVESCQKQSRGSSFHGMCMLHFNLQNSCLQRSQDQDADVRETKRPRLEEPVSASTDAAKLLKRPIKRRCRCRVESCEKESQGSSFHGMCKSHFNSQGSCLLIGANTIRGPRRRCIELKREIVKAAKKSGNLVALQEIAEESPPGMVLAEVKELLGSTFDSRRILVQPEFALVAAANGTDAHLRIADGRFKLQMTGAAANCLCATMRAAHNLNEEAYRFTALLRKQPLFTYGLRFCLPTTAKLEEGAKKSKSLVIRKGISIEDDNAITWAMDCSDQIDFFRKACYEEFYCNGKRKDGVDHEPEEHEIKRLIRMYITNKDMQVILLSILESKSTDAAECLMKTSLKHGLVFTNVRSSTRAWWIGEFIGYGFGGSHWQSKFNREEFLKLVALAGGKGQKDTFLALFFLFWAGFDGSIIYESNSYKCLEVIVPDLKGGECDADHTVKSLFIKDIFLDVFDVVPNQYSRPSSIPGGKSILYLRVCKRKDLYKIARRLEELVDASHFDSLPRKKKVAIEKLMQLADLEVVSGKLRVLIFPCVSFCRPLTTLSLSFLLAQR
jgi:hypothetical protein